MQKTISTQNKEYCKELNSLTIQQKMEAIQTDDLEHTFRMRYTNEMFVNFFDALKEKPFRSFQQQINGLFENANTVVIKGHEFQPDFFNFYKSEIAELESFIDQTNGSDTETRTKAVQYLEYLNSEENRWWRTDDLFKLMLNEKSYPSIAPLAKAKLKKEFISIDKLDQQQSELFRIIDRTYLLTLLTAENLKKRATFIERFQTWFDFDYYKDPFIFIEFPKDKNTFHKVLKSWIRDQVETRKKIFEWDEIPPEYQYFLDYANRLLPQAGTDEPVSTRLIEAVSESPLDYPKHIFAEAKAHELFGVLMRHFKTPNAISFVFRTMSEKEKPQLILVNDTPFRNWFNTQGYAVRLENHTKTYDNVKNEDRIAAYNIAKELIMK